MGGTVTWDNDTDWHMINYPHSQATEIHINDYIIKTDDFFVVRWTSEYQFKHWPLKYFKFRTLEVTKSEFFEPSFITGGSLEKYLVEFRKLNDWNPMHENKTTELVPHDGSWTFVSDSDIYDESIDVWEDGKNSNKIQQNTINITDNVNVECLIINNTNDSVESKYNEITLAKEDKESNLIKEIKDFEKKIVENINDINSFSTTKNTFITNINEKVKKFILYENEQKNIGKKSNEITDTNLVINKIKELYTYSEINTESYLSDNINIKINNDLPESRMTELNNLDFNNVKNENISEKIKDIEKIKKISKTAWNDNILSKRSITINSDNEYEINNDNSDEHFKMIAELQTIKDSHTNPLQSINIHNNKEFYVFDNVYWLSWSECKDIAIYLHGRLPTRQEVINFVDKKLNLDLWVPIEDYKNNKGMDWCQIGNRQGTTKHIGDSLNLHDIPFSNFNIQDMNNDNKRNFNKYLIIVRENVKTKLIKNHIDLGGKSSWDEFNKIALDIGGRLPTKNELLQFADCERFNSAAVDFKNYMYCPVFEPGLGNNASAPNTYGNHFYNLKNKDFINLTNSGNGSNINISFGESYRNSKGTLNTNIFSHINNRHNIKNDILCC